MAATRISRKSLKEPDEFISMSSKLLQQVMTHKTKFIGGFCGLIALVVVVSGLGYFSDRAENRGSLELTRLMDRYTPVIDDGPKAYEMVHSDFEAFLDDYSGKRCGAFARLAYANVCYRAGKFERAVELYTLAMADFDDEPLMKNIAAGGLGYTYEETKALDKASELFENFLKDPNIIMTDEVLFSLGRLYNKLDKKDQQARVLKQLADQYPNSMYKDIVLDGSAG